MHKYVRFLHYILSTTFSLKINLSWRRSANKAATFPSVSSTPDNLASLLGCKQGSRFYGAQWKIRGLVTNLIVGIIFARNVDAQKGNVSKNTFVRN